LGKLKKFRGVEGKRLKGEDGGSWGGGGGVPSSCNVVKEELRKRTLTSSQKEYSRVQIELIGV